MKPFTLGLLAGRSIRQDPRALHVLFGGAVQHQERAPQPSTIDLQTLLPEREPFRSLAHAVAAGDVAAAGQLASGAVRDGADPLTIALDGLLKGMDAVSVLYDNRQAFVPEVLLAARALRAGLDASGGSRKSIGRKGVVLLHTAEGDLHDIGKNIISAIVEANGYYVVDLGTSVETARVIETIRERAPIAVLGSSLMTSTRAGFLVTADVLRDEGISIPFIIGGGACDAAFAAQRENIHYARTPGDVVRLLDACEAETA